MKDKYLDKMEEWNENFFKNYKKMEKKIVVQLEKYGQQYFILNDCYQLLGRFDPTIKAYCEVCEMLGKNEGGLLQYYLHLNDIPNVKIQQKFLENSQHYLIYKDFDKYQDSGEVLKSKYVSIKYDKNIEEIANLVFEKTGKIDRFIAKEWKGLLPPVFRIIFMNHTGQRSFNAELNETYLPVKGMKKSDVKHLVEDIVAEIFHLISSEIIMKTKFGYDLSMNSFRLLDEGYLQLVQFNFNKEKDDTKKRIEYYSREIVVKGVLNFYDMKDKWTKLLDDNSINIYDLVISFAFFLEDKFEYEKFKKIFFPVEDLEENSWLEYAENYFGHKINHLIDEWKQALIDNEALVEEIESVETPDLCLNCKKYDNPKDKLDCTLDRFKQKDKKKFKCDRFEKEVATIVIYKSRSGFVKKYAEWISEELSADLKDYSQVSINDLSKYKTIIYGGGIYVSGINGIKLIMDNLDKLEEKKIIIFATGASTGKPEDIDNIKRKNFTYDQLKIIKFFYLRGGFDFKKLKFPYTVVMRLMKWKLRRQELLTADEQGMLDSFDEPTDFTSKENIKELIEEAC
jgi:menaquinone-dependent protoporphyrinogen IX oxidase